MKNNGKLCHLTSLLIPGSVSHANLDNEHVQMCPVNIIIFFSACFFLNWRITKLGAPDIIFTAYLLKLRCRFVPYFWNQGADLYLNFPVKLYEICTLLVKWRCRFVPYISSQGVDLQVVSKSKVQIYTFIWKVRCRFEVFNLTFQVKL